MHVGEVVPEAMLERPVVGVGLVPGTLGDQLGGPGELRVLAFLRHFGCLFCRETVGDLRALAEADPDFPPVLFFFQGAPTEGRAFLRRDFPGARAISDPTLAFYDDFGVSRGSLLQMLGPKTLLAHRRAKAKGYDMGERSGDIWRMPGLFLMKGREVIWSYEYHHAGELPDWKALAAAAREAR